MDGLFWASGIITLLILMVIIGYVLYKGLAGCEPGVSILRPHRFWSGWWNISHDSGRQQLGELVDVAPGGAQVHLDYPLDPGTPVRLDSQVPGAGGAEAYSFSADVRWRRDTPQGAAHGLAFAGLGPDSVRRLTELVKPQP